MKTQNDAAKKFLPKTTTKKPRSTWSKIVLIGFVVAGFLFYLQSYTQNFNKQQKNDPLTKMYVTAYQDCQKEPKCQQLLIMFNVRNIQEFITMTHSLVP